MTVKIHFKVSGKSLFKTTVNWRQNKKPGTVRNPAKINIWPTVTDHIRGCYNSDGASWKPFPRIQRKTVLRLALLVESPHKDEFDSIFNPLCPINGAAGTRFSKNICIKLSKWFPASTLEKKTVEIKVFNPIQYQASLYHFLNGMIEYNKTKSQGYSSIDNDMRDDVWRFLFNDCDLKEDFLHRIRDYAPDLIVNCCTGKVHLNFPKRRYRPRTDLKAFVRYELWGANLINSTMYREDIHPSRWN